jgi:outer membrane protein
LAFNVAKAYFGVLLTLRNADLISKNIDNLQRTLDESIQIFEQGFLEKLDIDRLQLSLNNLKLEQEKVVSLIDLNKNVLKFSMGMPPGEKIEVTGALDEIMPTDYEQVTFDQITPDYSRRPEYLVLQKVDKLNELNIKRIQFEYLPVLRGFGSYSQVLQGNSISRGSWFPTSLVGLTLEVPIFDGFDRSSRIDRAKIERDKNLLILNDLEKSISLEVENAKIALQNAMKTLESAKQNQVLAQSIYDTALIKYREGVGSSLEITQAEADLYTAQGRYLTSLYELLIAKVDLEKSTGSLLK